MIAEYIIEALKEAYRTGRTRVYVSELAAHLTKTYKVHPYSVRNSIRVMEMYGDLVCGKNRHGKYIDIINSPIMQYWIEQIDKEKEKEKKKEEEKPKEEKKEEEIEKEVKEILEAKPVEEEERPKVRRIDYATDKQRRAIKNWIKYIADKLGTSTQIVKEIVEEMAKVKIDNFMTKEEASEVIDAIKDLARQKNIKLPESGKSKRRK